MKSGGELWQPCSKISYRPPSLRRNGAASDAKVEHVTIKKAATPQVAAWSVARLLRDTVGPLARFGPGGLDLQPALLGGGREEAAHAVRLPIRGLHDLGQGRALGPSDQRQDLRPLAVGARRGVFLGMGGLSGLFVGLGFPSSAWQSGACPWRPCGPGARPSSGWPPFL